MSKINPGLQFLQPTPDQSDLPLLIFLPGMDGTGELLIRQIPNLKEFFNLRCLKIPQDDLSNWQSLKLGVINLLTTLKRTQPQTPIYLCGESFGGCLALAVATEAPWLWQRLILVNPASCFRQRPWLSWGIPLTQWLPNFIYPYSTIALLPFLAALPKIEPRNRTTLFQAINTVPPYIVSWRLNLLQNFCLVPQQLQRLTQPVLLIASQSDRLLPSVEAAEYLQTHIPGSQLVILPDSGHACLLEQQVDLTSLLRQANFLTPAAFLAPETAVA